MDACAALPPAQRLESAQRRRRRANACYAAALAAVDAGAEGGRGGAAAARGEALEEACSLYRSAVALMQEGGESMSLAGAALQGAAREVEMACGLNLAAALALLGREDEVVQACDAVLVLAPSNRKVSDVCGGVVGCRG